MPFIRPGSYMPDYAVYTLSEAKRNSEGCKDYFLLEEGGLHKLLNRVLCTQPIFGIHKFVSDWFVSNWVWLLKKL